MKRFLTLCIVAVVVTIVVLLVWRNKDGEDKPDAFVFIRGPVNGAIFQRGNSKLAIYGAPKKVDGNMELVLVTHHRRDVVWAARELSSGTIKVIAPAAERELIETPTTFWADFVKSRFHDYAQQSTKVLAIPLPVDRWVNGQGDC